MFKLLIFISYALKLSLVEASKTFNLNKQYVYPKIFET